MTRWLSGDAMAWRRRDGSATTQWLSAEQWEEREEREGREGRRLGVARPLQESRNIGIVLNFKNYILGA